MNLFSKEKDLIQRIANLVLVLWLVGALYVFYSSTIDLVIKKPLLTYEEYQVERCGKFVPKIETDDNLSDDADYCQKQYEQYKVDTKDRDYYNKKGLVDAVGNVVIVGLFLFLLNRK